MARLVKSKVKKTEAKEVAKMVSILTDTPKRLLKVKKIDTRINVLQDVRELKNKKRTSLLAHQEEVTLIVYKLIKEHPKQAQQYRNGAEGLLGFFVAKVMEEMKGDPNTIVSIIKDLFGISFIVDEDYVNMKSTLEILYNTNDILLVSSNTEEIKSVKPLESITIPMMIEKMKEANASNATILSRLLLLEGTYRNVVKEVGDLFMKSVLLSTVDDDKIKAIDLYKKERAEAMQRAMDENRQKELNHKELQKASMDAASNRMEKKRAMLQKKLEDERDPEVERLRKEIEEKSKETIRNRQLRITGSLGIDLCDYSLKEREELKKIEGDERIFTCIK